MLGVGWRVAKDEAAFVVGVQGSINWPHTNATTKLGIRGVRQAASRRWQGSRRAELGQVFSHEARRADEAGRGAHPDPLRKRHAVYRATETFACLST